MKSLIPNPCKLGEDTYHTVFLSVLFIFVKLSPGFSVMWHPRFFLNRGKGMLGLETWCCWLRPLETFLHGNSWQSIAAFWPFWDCGKVQLEMPKKKKKKSIWYLFNLTILKKKKKHFSAKLCVDLILDVELLSQKKCIYFLCGLVIEKRWIKKEEEKVNPRGDGLIVKNLFS